MYIRVRVIVFYTTFNNISVISWRSVLLVEETGEPGENHRPVANHWQTLSYCSWFYNYLCNQCLSPLTLWIRILLRQGVLDTTLCDKHCQWLEAGRWFSPVTPVSSTNKTDRHYITEMLLKMALNIISQTKPTNNGYGIYYL
jgi:hypothetical protein